MWGVKKKGAQAPSLQKELAPLTRNMTLPEALTLHIADLAPGAMRPTCRGCSDRGDPGREYLDAMWSTELPRLVRRIASSSPHRTGVYSRGLSDYAGRFHRRRANQRFLHPLTYDWMHDWCSEVLVMLPREWRHPREQLRRASEHLRSRRVVFDACGVARETVVVRKRKRPSGS